MQSGDDHVRETTLGSDRLVRSVRAIYSRRWVLAGLVITLCAWASLTGVAQAFAPGTISTVAGDGIDGYTGNGGLATSAELNYPNDVVADPGGDLLMVDSDNSVVRLVAGSNCTSACPFGLTAMTKGHIYAVAGTGTAGYSGDGGPAASAQVSYPFGLTLDRQGDLLIADQGNNVVRLVAKASCASACPFGLKSMVLGDIYTIAGDGTVGFAGDDGPATTAELNDPERLAVDQAGNLVISDAENDGCGWWPTRAALRAARISCRP